MGVGRIGRAVAVAHRDRARRERAAGSGRGRVRRLLRCQAAGRHGRRPAGLLEDDHRGVEAGHLERRVQHTVEELVELDRRAEVAQEPVALALPLGALQGLREVAAEIVHARAHLVDGLDEPVVARRGRRPTRARHDETDDGQERRGSGDQNDGCSARDAAATLPRAHCNRERAVDPEGAPGGRCTSPRALVADGARRSGFALG